MIAYLYQYLYNPHTFAIANLFIGWSFVSIVITGLFYLRVRKGGKG